VAASADLSGLGYALVPTAGSGPLLSVLGSSVGGVTEPARSAGSAGPAAGSPFVGSSALVGALCGVPQVEIPGVRLVLRPEFDLTPETAAEAGPRPGGVVLGRVLDRTGAATGDLVVSAESLNRHTFVCGATGSGKSQTVRHLLEQASAAGVPWLVVEPAKAEYAAMACRVGGADPARRPG
jgi:hypothetical protein